MIEYLIVCPLVFLAGLVDAIAGGGGLISLPAYMIAGLPAHMALGTNKLASVMGTSVSTARFAKNGFIPWKLGLSCAALALAGSFAGSNLSLLLSERLISGLMVVVLPIVALYVFKNKNMGDDSRAGTIPARKSFVIALLAAFGIGAYDGFYGPGTGTFLILILTGAARYDMKTAAGVTKAINLASNVAAVITFVLNGKMIYSLGIAAGFCSIAGNYIGSGLVLTDCRKYVRPTVLIVLVILFLKVIFG